MATSVGATGVPAVSQQTSQLPSWYNQLALNFGNATNGALSNINGLGDNWYSGPRVADFSGLQNQAFGDATTAGTQYKPGFDSALQQTGDVYSQLGNTGQYDPSEMMQHMSPYLNGALTSLTNQSNQNLFQNVMPQVNSTFTGSGQFGSSRNGDFLNNAIMNNQQTINNSAGTMLNNAYGQAATDYSNWDTSQQGALSKMLAASQQQGNMANTGTNQNWTNIGNMSTLGGQQQALQQKALDTSYGDWQTRQAMPVAQMGALSQMIPNFASLYGKNTTTVDAAAPQQSTGTSNWVDVLNQLSKLYS